MFSNGSFVAGHERMDRSLLLRHGSGKRHFGDMWHVALISQTGLEASRILSRRESCHHAEMYRMVRTEIAHCF
jgi:hypothetical protein